MLDTFCTHKIRSSGFSGSNALSKIAASEAEAAGDPTADAFAIGSDGMSLCAHTILDSALTRRHGPPAGMRADGSVEPALRGGGRGGVGKASDPSTNFESFRRSQSNSYHTRLERLTGGR